MKTGTTTVEESVFRNVAGHFASGVTVIATSDEGQFFGTTASAVSSLSMDPPMMLVCLNQSSSTHDRIVKSGMFTVNILTVNQSDIAAHFGRKSANKFAEVSHVISPNGLPLIDGALATIECVVTDTARGGTHTVFLGEVIEANTRPGDPLAYYRGRFDSLARSLEAGAYERVRTWVLQRGGLLGENISISHLAWEIGGDENAAYNALIRLEAEGLVTRTPGGAFTPTPITADLIDNLYDARATIESGVIEQYLADASDRALSEIARLAENLAAREPRTSEELDSFLEANLNLHTAIVSLAGSRQLVSQFRQLSLSAVWNKTYESAVWQEKLGHPLIPELINALVRRNVQQAAQIVRTQVDFVKNAAKEIIRQRGGAL